MNDYIGYLKSLSVKKKAFICLSAMLFLYELIGGIFAFEHFNIFFNDIDFSVINLYTHIEIIDWFISLLSMPILLCEYFTPLAVYMILFPIPYFIFNLVMLRKKHFTRNVIRLDIALLIVHPQIMIALAWLCYFVLYSLFDFIPPFIRIFIC